MRTLLITAAAAASALALATPASAQYYPAPPPPGYGYGYGYHNNFGHIRSLQVRVNRLQRQIERLDRRNIISEREADRLRDDARDLERRLHRNIRDGYGLNQREYARILNRLNRLEARLFRDAHDGRRWGWNDWDRDNDGRDDRWERRRDRDDDDD